MIEFMQVYFPIIINILLIAVLIIAIIFGIKLITFMDKMNNVAESVSDKVESLNGIFKAIDFATDKVNNFTNKAVDAIISGISKIFKRKSKKIDLDEEDINL